MKEALNEAMVEKEINSYIWKGQKELQPDGKYEQSVYRMVDMSQAQLKQAYDHCKTMLFNKDNRNPGRYLVLKLIEEQSDKCGAELFLRHLKQEKDIDRFEVTRPVMDFKNNNKEAFAVRKVKLHEALNVPDKFSEVSVDTVLDGCLDRLGAFDKKHITRTFILRQGVWLTPTESADLTEKNANNEIIDKLEVIRERLNIKDVEKLSINSRGLNYTELRAMLTLRPNKKYADLTTVQLETLRNRILYTLEETVQRHITSWENRMQQLEKVANYLGLDLN